VAALHAQWQALRQQRQQDLAARQHEVHALLETLHQQRGAMATQLHAELHQFRQTLQAETSEFVSVIAAERSLMRQQLLQELDSFHQGLSQSTAELREVLQSQVDAIRAEVRSLLLDNTQQRVQMRQVLLQDLTDYVSALQADVQTYLAQLEQERGDRAQQVSVLLSQSRTQRLAHAAALRQEFAAFRETLHHFCDDLRQSVWGIAEEAMPLALDQLAEQLSAPSDIKPPTAMVTVMEATERPIKTKPMQPNSRTLEEEIFNLVHERQGARLTELESALSINRFQAVDVLRSLIKKGMIVQRDRIYLIPEELSL
jgi:F0F1-type ATP synthase membrane subunit b/b'